MLLKLVSASNFLANRRSCKKRCQVIHVLGHRSFFCLNFVSNSAINLIACICRCVLLAICRSVQLVIYSTLSEKCRNLLPINLSYLSKYRISSSIIWSSLNIVDPFICAIVQILSYLPNYE